MKTASLECMRGAERTETGYFPILRLAELAPDNIYLVRIYGTDTNRHNKQ